MMVLLEFVVLSVKQTCTLFPFGEIGGHRGKCIYLRKDRFL